MIEKNFNSVFCLTTFINNIKQKQKLESEKQAANFVKNFKNTNTFLQKLKKKKQINQKLNHNILNFKEQKKNNSEYFNIKLFNQAQSVWTNYKPIITYILTIQFSRTNTFLQVMDFSGKIVFFYSAGLFKFFGRTKKSRYNVFQAFYNDLRLKLKFLEGKPLALHLKNVGSSRFWIIKKLKKKFFLQSIKIFEIFPYNGCRKKKIRRKKFKKRRNG